MNHSEINIGIDTSQSQLDIGVHPTGEFFCVKNDDNGIKEAIRLIKKMNPTRVLIESTGRLETPFVVAAFKAKLPIVVCNALHIRRFAQASGQLAKIISDLLTVRSQLLTESTMNKNRLRRMPKTTHSYYQAVLKTLHKELQKVDRKLDLAIEKVPHWQEKVELLMSSHSVGK